MLALVEVEDFELCPAALERVPQISQPCSAPGLARLRGRRRACRNEFEHSVVEDAELDGLVAAGNGIGDPRDGRPPIVDGEARGISGSAINPAARNYPREFIQTGISTIDGLNSLVRGPKLPTALMN